MADNDVPKAGRHRGALHSARGDVDRPPEERGLVGRIGRVEIDWPKSVGYFGGIGLAVALDLIEPPLALFIAAIPFVKLLKDPRQSGPVRVAADIIEGAAKPVGGDAESTVRISRDANTRRVKRQSARG